MKFLVLLCSAVSVLGETCLFDGAASHPTHQLNMSWPPEIFPNGDIRLNFTHTLDRDRVNISITDQTNGCVVPLEQTGDNGKASVTLHEGCFSKDNPTFQMKILRSPTCGTAPFTQYTNHTVKKRLAYDDSEQRYCYKVTIKSFEVFINGFAGDSQTLTDFLLNTTDVFVRKNFSKPYIQVWSTDQSDKEPFTLDETFVGSDTYQIVYFAIPDCKRLQEDDDAYLNVVNIQIDNIDLNQSEYTVKTKPTTGSVEKDTSPVDWIKNANDGEDKRCFVKVNFTVPQGSQSESEEMCVTFKVEGLETLNGRRLAQFSDGEEWTHEYGITTRRADDDHDVHVHYVTSDYGWTDSDQTRWFAFLAMVFALILLVWKCMKGCGGAETTYAQPYWGGDEFRPVGVVHKMVQKVV